MGKWKKWSFYTLFLVLVLGATAYGLLHGSDFGQLIGLVTAAQWSWWLPGIWLVVLFILGESLIFHDILKTLQIQHRLSHCCLYSFIGFFFSCITPSAGGGQPAQVFFMQRDGIRASDSVPVMLLVTITYKMVLVLYAVGILLFRPAAVLEALKPVRLWCAAGLLLNGLFIGFYILLMVRPSVVGRFLSVCIRLLSPLVKKEKLERLRDRKESWMAKYSHTAKCFAGRWRMLAQVMLLTVVQRSLLFAVTYLAMRSFGIAETGMGTVVALQAMISLGTDLLPLPGGMGANETMFLLIFPALCGKKLALPVLLVSRGLSYYAQLLISAGFTLAAGFVIGRRKGGRT